MTGPSYLIAKNGTTVDIRIRDVFEALAEIPDGTIDLVLTSPPFLALRSYLPADHPDKAKEIGSEANPAEFIDTLLRLSAEWRRVLAPHGSICVELGDTYAGSWVGDSTPLADNLNAQGGSRLQDRRRNSHQSRNKLRESNLRGWPLDKSMCGIPHLYHLSLAYGRNLLTGEPSPAGQWRIRNVIAWCRPNPPVGALGDKFRPATSYMTVATIARNRWFDLDAVRTAYDGEPPVGGSASSRQSSGDVRGRGGERQAKAPVSNPAGAPPLDWWEIPTEPYSGAVRGDTLYRASRDCPEHSLPAIQHRLQTAPSGELREALLRNSRRTDASPALKRACVLHANSDLDNTSVRLAMKDWLDQSIQSERTTGSTAESRRPAPGSSEGTPPGYARTLRRTSHTPDERAALDQTMEQLPLGYAETATPHNTASSRTGLAPATSHVGTPSARTPADIEHTSSGLASSGQHLDIDESSTSEACPLADEHGTSGRTAGRSSRCSCEQFTESTSHYATFPKALLTRPILAMCPEKVCTVCGEPSRRIVGEAEYVNGRTGAPSTALHLRNGKHIAGQGNSVVSDGQADRNAIRQAPTLGWTDCGCSTDGSHWRRGVVLDPFGGSGTTAVVASRHGRDCIMIDLDPRNLELMRERLDDDALLVEREAARGLPSLFDWSES